MKIMLQRIKGVLDFTWRTCSKYEERLGNYLKNMLQPIRNVLLRTETKKRYYTPRTPEKRYANTQCAKVTTVLPLHGLRHLKQLPIPAILWDPTWGLKELPPQFAHKKSMVVGPKIGIQHHQATKWVRLQIHEKKDEVYLNPVIDHHCPKFHTNFWRMHTMFKHRTFKWLQGANIQSQGTCCGVHRPRASWGFVLLFSDLLRGCKSISKQTMWWKAIESEALIWNAQLWIRNIGNGFSMILFAAFIR